MDLTDELLADLEELNETKREADEDLQESVPKRQRVGLDADQATGESLLAINRDLSRVTRLWASPEMSQIDRVMI